MLPSTLQPWLLSACLLLALPAGAQVTLREDAVGQLLNEWYKAGTAAGLAEITYENRDGQHSPLDTAQYPQLQVFQPGAKTGPTTGPAVGVRMKPTIGNCSMAAPADKGGSLPRMYQMDPKGNFFLMMQYLANNLMLYPEHQDHDIGANGIGGYGDLYPGNNPCSIISQGSSGSDQPFLKAVLSTIAAFPPETQRLLIDKRVLIPTVQAIFRQSNKMVKKEQDYFSGIAHPVVFDAAMLDEEKMIRMAHDMRPPMIPPLVQLQVTEETGFTNGKDYFEAEPPPPFKLADTPVSIVRVMRGNRSDYTLTINTQKSADVMGRPVQLRWQLLQGDPRLVRLEASDKEPVTRLHIRWQPPQINGSGIRSHRLDIGVFATNGVSVSAPSFISIYMLPNEMRFYDDKGRVSEICYQAHNPDLGLPPTTRDLRWLKAMLSASLAGDGLRSRLMEKLLTETERQGIQKVWLPLNERWQKIQALETKPEQKAAADTQRNLLLDDLVKTLEEKLPGNRDLTVRSAVERSLTAIAGFSDLFLSFRPEILALAAKSPEATASADIAAQVARLKDLGVLIEQADGSLSTANPPGDLTPADRYYLSGLNLTIMSQVLFPDALDRSTAPAWVDARLTTPKAWRDVQRYDEEGKLTGWIRHQAGRTAWFDAEGRYLPEGPKQPDKAQAVIYAKNAQGLLEWRAK